MCLPVCAMKTSLIIDSRHKDWSFVHSLTPPGPYLTLRQSRRPVSFPSTSSSSIVIHDHSLPGTLHHTHVPHNLQWGRPLKKFPGNWSSHLHMDGEETLQVANRSEPKSTKATWNLLAAFNRYLIWFTIHGGGGQSVTNRLLWSCYLHFTVQVCV